MTEWFGRQADRIRRIAALVMAGKTDELLYSLNNRWRKIDLEHVSVDLLGLSPDRSHFHSSSGGPDCARILRSLRIPPGSVGLDLGSGKGGAAMTMARFPFAEVIGVELSEALVRMALTNVQPRGCGTCASSRATRACSRISTGSLTSDMQPFSLARDRRRSSANLRSSLARCDREVTLICRNPLCHDPIVAEPRTFDRISETFVGEHW